MFDCENDLFDGLGRDDGSGVVATVESGDYRYWGSYYNLNWAGDATVRLVAADLGLDITIEQEADAGGADTGPSSFWIEVRAGDRSFTAENDVPHSVPDECVDEWPWGTIAIQGTVPDVDPPLVFTLDGSDNCDGCTSWTLGEEAGQLCTR
jgi:hypothetical protein